MKHFLNSTLVLLVSSFLILAPQAKAEPGHVFKPLTPDEISAITKALPAKATAKPAKPRALLVFYRTEGFVHGSIPYANEALRQLGEHTGAFKAELSEDMSVFTPENLAKYDAVLFQNTTHLAFDAPAQRQALLDFVKSGKGLIGIHAASDNFYNWPEAQAMLGGIFHSHPWVSKDTVAVKVDDPQNPVVAAFGRKGFWIREEIYQIVGPYGRDKQRVLLSLDMSKSDNQRPADKLARTDNDFPVAWLKPYEKGRVFFSSIGHNPELFHTPEILQHYLDGIQFALGDLKADATPVAKSTGAALAPEQKIAIQDKGSFALLPKDAYDKLAAYDFGMNREPLLLVDTYIRTNGSKAYPSLEQGLLKTLARPSLPPGATDYILRTLSAIGSETSVPVLTKFLSDPKLSSLAIFALVSLRNAPADAALVQTLDTTSGSTQIAVINAVGRRHLEPAIAKLAGLAGQSNAASATAAVTALGEIGTVQSLHALHDTKVSTEIENDKQWALLSLVSKIPANTLSTEAEPVYRELLNSQTSESIRIGALQGFVKIKGEESVAILIEKMNNERPSVRLASANLLGNFHSKPTIAQVTTAFPDFDLDSQLVLLNSLAKLQTPDVTPVLGLGMKSGDPLVRAVAIRGLGDTGDPTAVKTLIALYVNTLPDESKLATESLSRLKTPGVTEAVIRAINEGAPANRVYYFQILAARQDHKVFPLALAAVDEAAADVHAAALEALADTAKADDLPALLGVLPKAKNASERRTIQRGLLLSVRSALNHDTAVDSIANALPNAEGESRRILLITLATIGSDRARKYLIDLVHSDQSEQRLEVIRSLSASKNPGFGDALLNVAQSTKEENEQILALRGYLDLLAVQDSRSEDQIVKGYAAAWPLAQRPEEKDAIMAALKTLKGNSASKLVAQLAPPPTKS
ncbi:MAG TPA: ThuA domain-containing protein [Opitutaceae bacterium]|nr:ThuA domain-containing protein [Opitutaceae bacterium]